jgi:glycosyltransferase involved in cell wall biosynthesis
MAGKAPLVGRRVAIVYDCLFPYTVGGGERWYRCLAEGLTEAGAQITYLTRRQWDEAPQIPGVQVVAVSGATDLYDRVGKRRLLPTLRFGCGLLRWLLRNRQQFDVVQVASFPFWSVFAVRLALLGTQTRVVVDWFEIWSARYWRAYAGAAMGTVGYLIARSCLAVSPTIIVLSTANARRLRALGRRDAPVILAGLLPPRPGSGEPGAVERPSQPPYVLFAGRHIRDKGVDLLPDAFAAVHRVQPDLGFVIAGDGPLRDRIIGECRERGIAMEVELPGFVSEEDLEHLLRHASCVVVPSRREGYGFMPVDAMGKGTPVVTTAFEDNLAVANIEPGRNGFVASPPTAEGIAEAILAVLGAGVRLRQTTLEWYEENAPSQSIDCSVLQMVQSHARWADSSGSSR